MRPFFHPVDEEPVLEQALFAGFRRSYFYGPEFAVSVGEVLDAYISVVNLVVRSKGQVEHRQGTRAELVHRSADGIFGVLGWGERRSSEFVAVATEQDHTDAVSRGKLPRSLQDLLALDQVPTPRILGPELPIFREGHTRDDEFPMHTTRRRRTYPGQQVGKLRCAEHRLLRIIRVGVLGAPISPGVDEEEVRWALDEAEVRVAIAMHGGISRHMVVLKGVVGGHGDAGQVAVPVVLDFVVIDDVNPGEILTDGGPVWRRVDLSVFSTVVLCVSA